MQVINDLREQRIKKLTELRGQGIEPYGARFLVERSIQQVRDAFQEDAPVRVAGRMVGVRQHGKLVFADLRDQTGKIQIWLKSNEIGEESFTRFLDLLDVGDILGVEGTLCMSRTGEMTVKVASYVVLSKNLLPLPEKWHGLKDVEVRYRKRYVDLIANPEVMEVFLTRSRILQIIRRSLDARGFSEVETPILQPLAGGAAGEPFVTHHHALDAELYLRLAPELYLKKLLVGGFDKVYEIGRSFRNEGLSPRHNPEFTMLELYQSYANYETMMALTESLICEVAGALGLGASITYKGRAIDLTPPWERRSFAGEMERLFGIRPGEPLDVWERKLAEGAKRHGLDLRTVMSDASRQRGQLTRSALATLIEELMTPKDEEPRPVFITDFFTEFSPLSQRKPDQPDIVERFELFIGGMEIANAYSELNDPIDQRQRFEAQVADDPARRVDTSFVEALEYGMPPAGGLGIGIDRLAMLMTGQESIKDVLLFPQLRHEVSTPDEASS